MGQKSHRLSGPSISRRPPMRLGGVLLLMIGLVSGCASSNQADAPSDEGALGSAPLLIVTNRTQENVRVYLNWEDVGRGGLAPGRQRRLLEQLRSGGTGRYTVPSRWGGISLSADPSMTPRNDDLIRRTDPFDRRGPTDLDPLPKSQVIEVGPGDVLEWEIRVNNVFYYAQLIAHNPGR